MKNKIIAALAYFAHAQTSFATSAEWILWSNSWVTEENLRNGDIHTENLPQMIVSVTNFLMGISWTIAIIFIIIWAYQMLFWSLAQKKSAWRDTIVMALIWFAVTVLAYFIIRLLTDNLKDFL